MVYSFIFSVAAIAASTYLFFEYNFCIGGSVVFGLLIALSIAIEQRMERMSSELRSIRFILVVMIGLNFLSFWEISGRIVNVVYLGFLLGSFFLMLPQYSLLALMPFRRSEDLDETDQNLIKRIRQTLTLPLTYVGVLFSTVSALMVYFIKDVDPVLYAGTSFLRISYISVASAIFFLLITLLYLMKIQDEEMERLLSQPARRNKHLPRYRRHKVRSYSWGTLTMTVIMGSAFEMLRGMWVMWIETIALLVLMSLILWKTYRFYLFDE